MAWLFYALYAVVAFDIVFIAFAFFTIVTLVFTRVPFVRTPRKNAKIALNELNLAAGSKIYDLGCGDGNVLFLAEKMGYKATGYELSPYPYLKARINKFITGSRVNIIRSNFFRADLSQADCVFLFLIDSIMEKVGKKLKANLRPGTPVVSYGFKIHGWQPVKILDTQPSKVYIYKS
ncbi:MAG: hypothetical protein WCW77_04220 [Patescibacteria group bacterium]|jgi:SAM-dependent methyltransferase